MDENLKGITLLTLVITRVVVHLLTEMPEVYGLEFLWVS